MYLIAEEENKVGVGVERKKEGKNEREWGRGKIGGSANSRRAKKNI